MARAIILVLIFSLFYWDANACSCEGPYEFKTLEDLNSYHFIAFAEIESTYYRDELTVSEDGYYVADLKILELFKGEEIKSIRVFGGSRTLTKLQTSCDIGIGPNQKWLIFGYSDEFGNISTGACTFTTNYSNEGGERDWQLLRGIFELGKLQELYGHLNVLEEKRNGTYIVNYPNGSVEIQETFKNGLLDGKRSVYYLDGSKSVTEEYKNGQLDGKVFWYSRRGVLEKDYNYQNGHPVDTCRVYHWINGKLRAELLFDIDGFQFKSDYFNREAIPELSYRHDKEANRAQEIKYHPSGKIFSLDTYSIEPAEYLNSKEYYESGILSGEWEFFPSDSVKLFLFTGWSESGQILKKFLMNKDQTKIEIIKNN